MIINCSLFAKYVKVIFFITVLNNLIRRQKIIEDFENLERKKRINVADDEIVIVPTATQDIIFISNDSNDGLSMDDLIDKMCDETK